MSPTAALFYTVYVAILFAWVWVCWELLGGQGVLQ